MTCGIPHIDLSAAGLLPGAPAVHSDVRAEAELGFAHLWERGFRNLAFSGVNNYRWVRWQQERFCELATAAGVKVSSFIRPLPSGRSRNAMATRRELVSWLRQLPKPVGVFACYDLLGQQVLDACRAATLRVPDEVAVVGVDNDDVRCSLCDPPLSSVMPDTRGIGFLASELLAQRMAGRYVAPGMRIVQPQAVRSRRSTDALAIADAEVSAALRLIRNHCCEPITVELILQKLHLSRRSFEARFIRLVGRTPHAEILKCRLEQAQELLRNTDLPIKAVAARVGVGTPEYLSVLFRRVLSITPSAFRATLHRGSRVFP
jgi:LacI family transcriptional regulator